MISRVDIGSAPHGPELMAPLDLTNGAPRHGDQNPALHALDERNRLVDGLRPALDAPGLLPADFPLFQVCKLPQVVHGVQFTNLHEPGTHTFHDLPTGLETVAPMALPFKKVPGVKSVGSELEETTKAAGRSGGPEGEFLHQGRLLALDKCLQLAVEFGEFGVFRNVVQ